MPASPYRSYDDEQSPSPPLLPVFAGKLPSQPPKVKQKNGKGKKKNDVAAAEQASKEKAAAVAAENRRDAQLEPDVPSPTLHPSPPPEPEPDFSSPVLTALGERPFGKTHGFDTTAWASNIPYGASPPSRPPEPVLAAASPPSFIPTYRDELRGGFSQQSPSTSPHAPYRAPARPSISGQTTVTHLPLSPRGRPVSMPTHYPPEPSVAQYSHAPGYRTQHSPSGFKSRSTSRKSSDKEFLAFDILPASADDAHTTGDLALLAATEESLHVFRVDRDGIHKHGCIEGLRGQVVTAKILPTASRHDQLRRLRPLIAIVVHGVVATSSNMNDSQHSEFDPSNPAIEVLPTIPGRDTPPKYQTTVEVYSLKDRCHIATLYRSPLLDLEIRLGERYPEPPKPFGALSIQAKGRFVVVYSAVSGEVYMYEVLRDNSRQPIKCIGKTWTTIQGKKSRSWSVSSGTSVEKELMNEGPSRVRAPTDIALVSLSSRWLAIVPPIAGSKPTLHGTVDESVSTRNIPGVTSHTSSSQPQVTCELETPLEDSRFNKVARDVTQEVLKGARWVGDQGMQAWKNYWNKPEEAPSQEQIPPVVQQQFPPTHADETMRASQQPTLVSVLDLERLSEGADARTDSALTPLATFSLTDGCSYLSFNPSGLSLLTATAKGDVCYVWDLMRVAYGRSMDPTQDSVDSPKAFVRQIAKFARVTIANIVDVVWAEPRGERLAIITDRGTVHLHDVPPTAFQWPPPRPKRPPQPRKRSSDAAPTAQPGGFGAAFNAVSSSAQPIFAAVRGAGRPNWANFNMSGSGAGSSTQGGRTASGGFGFNIPAGAGVAGGRIVSSGLSKSMGAASGTVDSLLRMGESRLHLPGSSRAYAIGSTQWFVSKEATAIVVVGGGTVRMHNVLSNADVKGKKRHSVVGLQLAEFSVPKVKGPAAGVAGDGTILGGYWPETQRLPRVSRSSTQPISYAELETSAPFTPFHADRRVNLNVYDRADHHMDGLEPWVFGGEIPTTQIITGSEESSEDAQLGPEAGAPLVNLLDDAEGDLEAIAPPPVESPYVNPPPMDLPPVITTTKKKKGKKKGSMAAPQLELDDDNPDNGVMIDFAHDRV